MHADLHPLREALDAGVARGRIEAWRLSWTHAREASLGVRDAEIAHPHQPLVLEDSLRASLLLHWADGRLSSAQADRSRLGQPDEILAEARLGAYEDPDAALFAGASAPPELPLHSEAAAAIPEGDLAPLAELLESARATSRASRFKVYSGTATATARARGVQTSRGCALAGESTAVSYSFWFEGRTGDGLTLREPIPGTAARPRLERAAGLTVRLATRERNFESGSMPVILHPHVARSFFLTYLVGNLSGESVWNRQSAFRIEQFRDRERVAREDLSFSLDPLVPMSAGSFRFTTEGVPARRGDYLRAGRLASPILDLKYAGRFGMEPLPAPPAIESIAFEARERPAESAAYAAIGRGLLVLQVLGLHTQDATSGEFSLPAPLSLAVRSGAVGGHVRAALAGNFLEALRSDDLRLIDFPGYHMPGLQLTARVSVD
jgi:PmbA protein